MQTWIQVRENQHRLSAENRQQNGHQPEVRPQAKPKRAQETPGQPTVADLLVPQVLRELELFHTPDGEPYATLRRGGHRETHHVASQAFKDWLGDRLHVLMGRTLSGGTATAAVNTLRALAIRSTEPTRPVYLRYAEHDGKLYVDLANESWQAVEISPEGWKVVNESPVRFVRRGGMRAMPRPQPGGSIDELRPFLNVRSERDFQLFVGAVLAAMNPQGPFPVLMLVGQHGSAKSTTERVFRDLVDPADPPTRAPVTDERDLMASAQANWVVAFDNVSRFDDAVSDAICRLATGAGWSRRKLYTDADEFRVTAKRPVVVNGINPASNRPDLLDRAIMIELPEIPPERRRAERQFWRQWELAWPRVLGGLFTALSAGLKNRETVQATELPRMADTANWVTACESGLGWAPGAFVAALESQAEEVNAHALAESPIGYPILDLAEAAGTWHGTATELLDELIRGAAGNPRSEMLEALPPAKLGGLLKSIEPNLRAAGVEIVHERTARRRLIHVRLTSAPISMA